MDIDSTDEHSIHMENLTTAERNFFNNIVEGYFHVTSMVGFDVVGAKDLAAKVLRTFDSYENELEQADKSLAKMLTDIVGLQRDLTKALAAYDAEVIGRREEVAKCHAEMGKKDAKINNLEAILKENAENSYAAIHRLEEERFDEIHRGCKALDDANGRIKELEAKLKGNSSRAAAHKASREALEHDLEEAQSTIIDLSEQVSALEHDYSLQLDLNIKGDERSKELQAELKQERDLKHGPGGCGIYARELQDAITGLTPESERVPVPQEKWAIYHINGYKSKKYPGDFATKEEAWAQVEKACQHMSESSKAILQIVYVVKQCNYFDGPTLGSHASDLKCLRATQAECDRLETENTALNIACADLRKENATYKSRALAAEARLEAIAEAIDSHDNEKSLRSTRE